MRAKPVTVGCRLTDEKKTAFYAKAKHEGKSPQDILEALIDNYLNRNDLTTDR